MNENEITATDDNLTPVDSSNEQTEENSTPPAAIRSPINQSEEESAQNKDSNYEEDQDSDERGTRWKEGDEITFVRVRFPGNSRSFPFLQGKRTFAYGQKVVAMSDRGMDVGYINSFPYTVKFKKDMLPIRSISKAAMIEDIEAMQGNIDEQKKAQMKASHIIARLNLDMQITHVEIIQFGKKMVFYFTAPARVDFRELVKQLVGELKMRIELRQISVRDRAAALGSIGACGLATCCSTFLKNYGNVTIKMAKNQNLALIPTKINGVCGQIKCCIKYEDHVYTDKRKTLPKEGLFLKAANGDVGKVTKLHILIEQFDMITEKGQIRRYARSQYADGKVMGKDYQFPNSFRHVVNETSQVIGLEEMEKTMADQFRNNMSDDEKAMANLRALKNDNHIVKKSEQEGHSESDALDNSDEENKVNNRNKKPRPPRKNNRNNKNRPKNNEAKDNADKTENSDAPKKPRPNKRKRRRPNTKNNTNARPSGSESKPSGDS